MAETGIQTAVDASEIERLRKNIAGLGIDTGKAISRTINEAVRKSRTLASRGIRDAYNITAADVRPALKTKLSRPDKLVGELDASAPMLPLIDFMVGGQRKSVGPVQPGARVSVLLGSQKTILNSFVATMKTGYVGIFERVPGQKTSAGHEKIKQLFTIGPGIMLGYQRAGPKIAQQASDYFRQRLDHNVEFLMKQALQK
jgi:hypothetical protein